MSDENQKKAYFQFRKDNGDKRPTLVDYLRHSSEIDPLDFGKIKIGGII